MNYYVDYFDFYLNGIGYRMLGKNRNQQLRYDLLCINPRSDKMIFTLTETLLEDSNRILIQYMDFWKTGVFKVALAKKYKTANAYINDRLAILYNSPKIKDNFELDIYQSDITNKFINGYLINDLKLKGKNSFIYHRTSNADNNNRTLFKQKINDYDLMYSGLNSLLNIREIDSIIAYLNNRADDKKMIFQRGYILDELFQRYPKLNTNHSFFYNLFDNNYNTAMALSVEAKRLSSLKSELNGIGLSNFVYYYDYGLYKEINSLNSKQLYELSVNASWQVFVQKVNELYKHLFFLKKIDQNYNIYKYFSRYVYGREFLCKSIIRILDLIINKIDIPKYMWFMQYEEFHEQSEIFIYNLFREQYFFCVANDVLKSKSMIKKLVQDIKKVEEWRK